METFIGFDSAWTDNPKAPGAVCATTFSKGALIAFYCPILATFADALKFIQLLQTRSKFTLVALDQPSIVPNIVGMRPVDRVAASLVSWLGGGVQPANRSKIGMFCDASPIWKFLHSLDAAQDPEQARTAKEGHFLIEVFPALALASIATSSYGRLKGLHYNPKRKTFCQADWRAVADAAAAEAQRLVCDHLAQWCRDAAAIMKPCKADQDRLDAALCLLIALRWRLRPREESLMIGDIFDGYMVLPASADVRKRLTIAAAKLSLPVDGLKREKLQLMDEQTAKKHADNRMTEPGIVIAGDDVIYDGEAEHLGVPPMTKAPPMRDGVYSTWTHSGPKPK